MAKNDRVAVLNIHWGFSVGGISQYATAIEGAAECGPIDVSTVCIANRRRNMEPQALNNLAGLTIIERNGPLDLRWVRRLRDVVAGSSPDLIFTHAFNGHFAACVLRLFDRSGAKYVASYHGKYFAPSSLKCVLAGLYNWFAEWYLRSVANSVVIVAEFGKAYLTSKGVAAEKISVVHNGIPDCVYDDERNALRRELGLPEKELVIGVISRLEPIKGVLYLLRAFQALAQERTEVLLLVIGSGAQEAYLKQLAIDLGIADRVTFAGSKPNGARYLRAFDIYVSPSLSEFHSIGLLEAMRASCAIVATRVGGNTESVTHDVEALVVSSANVEELAGALHEMVADPALRERLGRAARTRFEAEFRVDVMVRHTASFLLNAARSDLSALERA